MTKLNDQGCSQTERLADAPTNPDFLKLEERTFNRLLMEGVGFAKRIAFVDSADKVDGDWSKLLTHDESVIIALVERENRLRRKEKIRDRQTRTLAGESLKATLTAARKYLELTRKIDSWVEDLKRRDSAEAISLGVKLAETLDNQTELLDRLGEEVLSMSDEDLRLPLELYKKLNPGYRREPLGADFSKRIEAGYETLLRGLRNAEKFARHLEEPALSNQKHEPATALFLGFTQLLRKALASSDRLVPQHRDFYFRELLRIPRGGQKPDTAVLVVTGEDAVIEKGRTFVSEKTDTRDELTYKAVSDLKLAPVTVEALKTVTLHQDPFSVPSAYFGAVSNVAGRDFDAGADRNIFGEPISKHRRDKKTETSVGFAVAHPVLSLAQGKRSVRLTLRLNRNPRMSGPLAKALAKNFRDHRGRCDLFWFKRYLLRLLLDFAFGRGGPEERRDDSKITASKTWATEKIEFREQKIREYRTREYSTSQNDREFQNSWKVAEEALTKLKERIAEGRQALCGKLFGDGFVFSITTDEGWSKLSEFEVSLPEATLGSETRELKISLRMPRIFPPVAGYDPKIHTSETRRRIYDAGTPVVEALLNQDAVINNYSLLEECLLEHVKIEARAEGLKDLTVTNDLGPVDPSSVFQAFGPVPKAGNSLVIGSPELSSKQLTEMFVDIQWADLPRRFGGFRTHYENYGLEIANDSFALKTGVLSDGEWRTEKEPTAMFRENEKEQVLGRRRIEIKNLDFFQPVQPDAQAVKKPFRYSSKSVGGFAGIQLTGPETAFGHKEYPYVLTKTVSEAARLKKTPRPVNEPYTPAIKSFSVDYAAVANVDPAKAKTGGFYTIYPFGSSRESGADRAEPSYLLPRFDGRAALYIGFKAKPRFNGGRLTLFFELDESSVFQRPSQARPLRWAFYKNGSWTRIDDHAVAIDETDGFLSSGVVALDLPAGCRKGPDGSADKKPDGVPSGVSSETAEQTQMPDGLFWLQVFTTGDPALFCKLKAVEANALRVEGEAAAADSDIKKPPVIPAGSIVRPTRSIAGATKVFQPLASRNGLRKESRPDWIGRCSERLRHRQRAVQPWDYERLALQRFPEIERAKCFPATSQEAPNEVSPGHVLLVVVSKYPEDDEDNQTFRVPPRVSASRLDEIRDFILSRCGGRVRLEVRNPSFERIQIRCAAKFRDRSLENHGARRLNEAVSRFVSPWRSEIGNRRFFNWELSPEILDGYLSELPYVEHVTKLSMLKIAKLRRGRFLKTDTAQTKSALRPYFPWSIPLPTRKHAFEVSFAETDYAEIDPSVTGISELELGANFIVGGQPEGV